jgi:hypothetical protein
VELDGGHLMPTVRSGRRSVAGLALALALLGGCGETGGIDPEPVAGAGETLPPSGPAPAWLAAFRVESDSNALNADTEAIMEAAGPAIFAGPVACFGGFPSEHVPAPDAYVLGVVAPTRAEVEAAVERVGRDPLFVVQVTARCVD